ncbi:glycosyltransferase [Sulfurimonas indica]|uniref:glycosyltransferase n=1 Tax=Sulfurimonas indica TaxID=2508707 RepID=UPI001264982E|nr:glycosyltransferase [Sulfurimonas indica]
MKEQPLVTVLMPAYNHASFIKEAIESLIEQDYTNIEFIITNDGSTDNTHDVIMELDNICKTRFSKFQYINRRNKGLIKTLKEMETLINGKYLSILYSDDIFTKNKITKQVNALENNQDYALCFGNMIGIDDNSNIVKKYKTKYAKSGNVFNDLLIRNFIPAPTVMMRTKAFKSVGGYDLNFEYDDYPLWLKIAHKYKVLYLNEDLVFYRSHDNNVSSNMLRTLKLTENVLLSWRDEPIFLKAIKRFYLRAFYNLAKYEPQHKQATKEYMNKALASSWYDPRFIKAVLRYYLLKEE